MRVIEPEYGGTTIRLGWDDGAEWNAATVLGGEGRVGQGCWLRIAHERMSVRLPDLDDPATLGCLLALVREAWGDPRLYVSATYINGPWGVTLPNLDELVSTTEAEALVAALEAAGVGR